MFYALLEKAMNQLLKLDPDTSDRLSNLQGKVIEINITDWRMSCYVIIQPQGVRLTGSWATEVDTTVRGKLIGLIRAGRSGASGPVLFDQGIEVTGNTELGEILRDILRRIDFDGEEYLSRFIGDTTAHQISWRTKRLADLGKKTWLSIGENLREFCQYEAPYLPTREQVEDFYQQVAHLREGVDRAEARLRRLETQVLNRNLEP